MGFKFKDQHNYSNVWFNPDYSNVTHFGNHKHHRDNLDDVSGRRDDRDDDRKQHQAEQDDVSDRRDGRRDDKKRPWFFTL